MRPTQRHPNRPTTQRIARIGIWLVAEILLNLMGLDHLADYGEFVFDRHAELTVLQRHQPLMLAHR